jgi:SAM-dependent methyltransferase
MLRSCPCTEAQLFSPPFLEWADRLRPAWDLGHSGVPVLMHRKVWEWLFIVQALHERGMLEPGRRGLGFGVGREPLTALFASLGAEIVASDLDVEAATAAGWVATEQHAQALADLNGGLCDPDQFAKLVEFRVVDMNDIPDDLVGFDFTWSACVIEHMGSIGHAQEFILEQMRCLRPGGVAVHTTEFNASSDTRTVDWEPTVLLCRHHIEWLVRRLRSEGHSVEVDYSTGTSEADLHVDEPPFTNTHLKVRVGEHATTSFGLIIEKSATPLDPPPSSRAARRIRRSYLDARRQVVKRARSLVGRSR